MSNTFNGAIATMLGTQYAGTPTGTGPALPCRESWLEQNPAPRSPK